MENIENITLDEVLDVIIDFPIKPLGRRLLVTLNMEEVDGNMILSENAFSEAQYVVAVSDHILDIQAGDKVILDLEKMMEYVPSETNSYEKVGRIKIKPYQVNGKVYGMINENVVESIDRR